MRDILQSIGIWLAKTWMPAAVSWLVMSGAFTMYGYLIIHGNPAGLDDVILGRIMGTIDTAFGIVLVYWLGTSSSSKAKDDTIKSMTQNPQPPAG